jgi:hypothetical protein
LRLAVQAYFILQEKYVVVSIFGRKFYESALDLRLRFIEDFTVASIAAVVLLPGLTI